MEEGPLNIYGLRKKILQTAKELMRKYDIEDVSDSFLIEVIDVSIVESHRNIDKVILQNMKQKLERLVMD